MGIRVCGGESDLAQEGFSDFELVEQGFSDNFYGKVILATKPASL